MANLNKDSCIPVPVAEGEVPLVLHIIHELGTGGLENGLINIINRTPENRYRHAIVCLTKTGSFESRLTKSNVAVVSLYRRSGQDFGLYWKLWKIINRMKPVIVHTRNLSALEAQIPAFLQRGVKTVHGVHGRDVFDLEGKNKKYNLMRKIIRPLVGRYITVSRDLREWLISTIGVPQERVVQIYNGVDQSLFKPGDKPCTIAPDGFLTGGSVVVGTVGRLAEVKDQATLINAFATVLHSTSQDALPPKLILVGDGPMRGRLEQLVNTSGISEHTWITGDRDDIPDILRLFDLFVLPSLGEGISNTILEAMATGLPIVATNVGGTPELVEHEINGYLVQSGDSDRMGSYIGRLVHSKEQRKIMGLASLERVRNQFDWNRTVDSYLAVYDELLHV
ncbi:MAG: TIGR03088 family PEP-CTERM/XrtA system glycosyltransferase [Gammaproteobacteria bacterium]|nr:TIGR03088 family PEP-CTERM/XrtA system glycosyltransferase [Gammaproteobacteria bacterium]MCB1879113.1 TIGR03088 family PEP-CTERM/XrtA system glycosyltransferase [Gammaproteobacteria bacterium]MCP5428265.1 TIGR03088 family PEP-CTERM/XrtA system glycosyltransferase [Chromatiaceae bacterium]